MLKRWTTGMVAVGLFIASALYIAFTFQWREATQLVARADKAWFFLGGGTAIIGYWVVRAARWRLLMHGMQVRSRFLDIYLCSSVALSLSVFTPLQSGEVLKVELLKKYGGLERNPGYSAFLLERVADIYVVVSIGLVALAASTPLCAILIAAMLMALPIATYAALHRFMLPGRAGKFLANLQKAVKSQYTLALFFATTILSWAMVVFGWHASLRSVSIQIDLAQVLGLVSLVTLASIASLIPGGLGVAEAGIVELLLHYGISAPLGQAGALALRGFSILVIALGLVHYLLLLAIRHQTEAVRAGDSQ